MRWIRILVGACVVLARYLFVDQKEGAIFGEGADWRFDEDWAPPSHTSAEAFNRLLKALEVAKHGWARLFLFDTFLL